MAESNEMLGQGCGCYIQAHGTWITYCPMHKAAPEMQHALEVIQRRLSEAGDKTFDGLIHEVGFCDDMARVGLAAARGQEAEAQARTDAPQCTTHETLYAGVCRCDGDAGHDSTHTCSQHGHWWP